MIYNVWQPGTKEKAHKSIFLFIFHDSSNIFWYARLS